jgi:hypothetical protein
MPRTGIGVTHERCWRALAWSALLTSTLVSASLFQAVATAGTEGAVRAEPTPLGTSPATMPPAYDDDDAPAPCAMAGGQPLYAGQNIWLTQPRWQCANPLP